MQDERRHRRVEGPVYVEYRALDTSGAQGMGPVVNLSLSGARFSVHHRLSNGTPLELQFHVGRLGSEPVAVQGDVVWTGTATVPAGQSCEVGVAFRAANSRAVARMLKRVYVYWQQLLHAAEDV